MKVNILLPYKNDCCKYAQKQEKGHKIRITPAER